MRLGHGGRVTTRRKVRTVEAIECSHCDTKGTPATMRWGGVDGDVVDGAAVTIRGAVCGSCDPHAETVIDAGEEPSPTDADLDVWVREHGASCSSFAREVAEAAIEAGVVEHAVVSVPYGSTSASWEELPDLDDVPGEYAIATAQAWWETDRLDWAATLGTDGSMYLVARDGACG